MRYLNISQMAAMFQLSRTTVRKRLQAGGVQPLPERPAPRYPRYDMAVAGPALFRESS